MADYQVGAVVIGRNEGERLKSCLNSLKKHQLKIVYVDSGSTDGSVECAHKLGVEVVSLDLSTPFTAARARNEGASKLFEKYDELEYVQFIDGDCELVEGWLQKALAAIKEDHSLAVVCGRRKERYPGNSFYNLMCDIEWDTPIGKAKACGGDSLIRVVAFKEVGGFNPQLIAGEEPELCLRLRRAGWQVERIDALMTLHDAAISSFNQWWKRSVRAGYAFAEGAYLHGGGSERHWVKESLRAWVWAFIFPVMLLVSVFINPIFSLLLLSIYPIQILRKTIENSKKGYLVSFQLSVFSVVGKFSELRGQLGFVVDKLMGYKRKIIEYK